MGDQPIDLHKLLTNRRLEWWSFPDINLDKSTSPNVNGWTLTIAFTLSVAQQWDMWVKLKSTSIMIKLVQMYNYRQLFRTTWPKYDVNAQCTETLVCSWKRFVHMYIERLQKYLLKPRCKKKKIEEVILFWCRACLFLCL